MKKYIEKFLKIFGLQFIEKRKINKVSIAFILNGHYFIWNGYSFISDLKVGDYSFGNLTIWNRGLNTDETLIIEDKLKEFIKLNK